MITLLFVLFTLTGPVSDEWSQFRGPNGTGVSETKNLPTEFGPNKNVVWKAALPPGHSSPVLTHDRIFVTAYDKETLLVICLDRQTGKILWRREVPRSRSGRLQNVNGPASPSPVTDGKTFTFSSRTSAWFRSILTARNDGSFRLAHSICSTDSARRRS